MGILVPNQAGQGALRQLLLSHANESRTNFRQGIDQCCGRQAAVCKHFSLNELIKRAYWKWWGTENASPFVIDRAWAQSPRWQNFNAHRVIVRAMHWFSPRSQARLTLHGKWEEMVMREQMCCVVNPAIEICDFKRTNGGLHDGRLEVIRDEVHSLKFTWIRVEHKIKGNKEILGFEAMSQESGIWCSF